MAVDPFMLEADSEEGLGEEWRRLAEQLLGERPDDRQDRGAFAMDDPHPQRPGAIWDFQ